MTQVTEAAADTVRLATVEASDGASLCVREYGSTSGEPIIFLHSLFFDGSMFDGLCGRLGSGWRCVCPDHRGQGNSGGNGGDLSITRLASDTIALIESLGTPAHLFGSSMGGYVVFQVCLRRPDLVRGCVLSACTAREELNQPAFVRLEQDMKTLEPDERARRIANLMFGETFLNDPLRSAIREHWHTHFRRLRPDVGACVRGVRSRASVIENLPRLTVPTLLFAGTEDRAKSVADMEEIRTYMPGSRLVTLERTGHTPPIEAVNEVGEELSEWLSHIPTKGNH